MVTLFVVLLCRIWMNIKPQQNALKHKLCARFFMFTVNIYDLILDQSYRAYSLYLLMFTTSKIYFHEFWFSKLKGHGHGNYGVNMCYIRIFSKRSNKACFLKDPKFNLHTFDKHIYLYPPNEVRGVYWLHPVCSSVCLSVCPLTFRVRPVASTIQDGFFPYLVQVIKNMRGCVACGDPWPWPISWRSFCLDLENRVRSVASTVQDEFFLYLAQMITIIRGCVACYFFQNLEIWIFGKFLKFFSLALDKKIYSSWRILSIFSTNDH